MQSPFKQSHLKLPVPFTSSAYKGPLVPIPTLPLLATTVIAFFLLILLDPIQISNILVDSHILYFPNAVELCQLAYVENPIAVEYCQFACVAPPIAVDPSPSANVLDPMATE